ncbi:MAG TPA: hypothetical protein VK130_07655 [Steroidobacteraceae bacterium]|nr:hypothetical protein [Steroidobacteraceae bacterium]
MDNVTPIRSEATQPPAGGKPPRRRRPRSAKLPSLAGDLIEKQRRQLWRVSGILELAIAVMREQAVPEDKPTIWTALEGALQILDSANEALEEGVIESQLADGAATDVVRG